MAFKRTGIITVNKCAGTFREHCGQNPIMKKCAKDSFYGLTRTFAAWYHDAFSLAGNIQRINVRLGNLHDSVVTSINLNSVNSRLNQVASFSLAGRKHRCTNSTLFSGLNVRKFSDVSHPANALITSRNVPTLVPCGKKSAFLLHALREVSVICCRMKHSLPKVPPTRMMSVYDIERAITDEEAAKEFVYALKASERKFLYEELARFHGDTSILNNIADEPPTRQQLKIVMLIQMFPFIGFGFLDNFLMIVAGEYIDLTLGAALGISTMAAAAIGNWISDVCGLGSAHYVETTVSRFGLRHPHLSPEQVDMKSTKWASNLGKVIGVTIGCFLGMIPLLFFRNKPNGKKENSEVESKEPSKQHTTS
ncbi:unnamed protein product [Candidula unifasciata]|uniref:Transmembrane protein 65 n=1 Tax=Candidula unifasciata TaxID=100452 RepID=A0A8S3YP81_9EUPU|nr:unnamed protein product [Candidula unifasciata]